MKRKNLYLLISFILSNIFTITSCNNKKENLVIGDSLLSGYGLEKKDISLMLRSSFVMLNGGVISPLDKM